MDSPKSDYLFVYSSLLKGFPTPDYEYISQYFDFVGDARTRGRLSILGEILVGTSADEAVFIKGELYKIKEHDQFSFAIGQLDEYEGVNPEPPEKPRYVRKLTVAEEENGNETIAWVYWYNGNIEGLPVVASGSVLDYIHTKNK